MRQLIIAALLAASPFAMANTQKRVDISKMPGTVVMSYNPTTKVSSMAISQKKLARGERPKNLSFSEIALIQEKRDKAFKDQSIASERSESTSSAAYYGRGFFGGGYGRGYYGGVRALSYGGIGYGAANWGYPGYGGGYGGYGWYNPYLIGAAYGGGYGGVGYGDCYDGYTTPYEVVSYYGINAGYGAYGYGYGYGGGYPYGGYPYGY